MSTTANFILPSSETGTDYVISVVAPDAARESGPWAAVIFMDSDDQFPAAVEAYHAARSAREVPPLLLAGVGYGASYTKPANRRLRDYTPTPLVTEPDSGGADRFLAFLTATLAPELARRHSLRGACGLAGHSLGSLVVLHGLFQRRPAFSHFLASAPSLWWDDRAMLCSAQQLQRTGVALPAKLFLAVGDEDTPSMTGDLEQFEQQLDALPFPGLKVISRRFPQRNHYDVLPDAFRAGLVELFGTAGQEK